MSTLQRVMLDEQDKEDLEHVQPFVLTNDELPKYDLKYVGQQSLEIRRLFEKVQA